MVIKTIITNALKIVLNPHLFTQSKNGDISISQLLVKGLFIWHYLEYIYFERFHFVSRLQ